MKKKASQEAQMSVKGLDDRINMDAAKNVKASRSEETILGLMLMFDEFRHEAATGAVGLSADDFVTGFGKRVFETLCRLENSDEGFSKAMLDAEFGLDERSRIERLELDRRMLARNDREVFLAGIEALKGEKLAQKDEGDPFADLRRKQEKLRKAKEKKNT